MSTTIPQLCQQLQQLLIEDANQIGRESGLIQRQRKFRGQALPKAWYSAGKRIRNPAWKNSVKVRVQAV